MLGRHPLLLILTGLLSQGSGELYHEVFWEEQTHPKDIAQLTEPHRASSPDLTSPVPLPLTPVDSGVAGMGRTYSPNCLPRPVPAVYQGQSEHLSGLHQVRAWLRLVPEAGKNPMG